MFAAIGRTARPGEGGLKGMTNAASDVTRKSLAILKWFNFFLYGTIAILTVYFPVYFEEIGLSKVEIGFVMAFGPFISIFSNPIWGYWSDRSQNIKRILTILLIGNLLATVVVFQFREFVLIFAMMLVFFFFQTPTFSQTNSLILNAIDGTQHQFGAFRLWGSLGWALAAVAAGPVVAGAGVTNLWMLYAAMMAVSLIFTVGLPQGKAAFRPRAERRGYRKVITSSRLFLAFIVLSVFVSVPNSINSTFSSLYITELGGSKELIGWSTFCAAIFEIPVFLLLDRFLKRSKEAMIAGLVLVSILFVLRWTLMSLASDPLQVICIQMLHCITFGGYFYIGTSLTAMLISGEYRATGQAVYALAWGGISGMIAGLSGGWMFEHLGPQNMYAIGAGVSTAGVIGFGIMWLRIRASGSAAVSDKEHSRTDGS
jgi:PPP family 3-phenylpropionic acid transporter